MNIDYLITPWKHQLTAIKRASTRSFFGLFFEMGCLAGDTKVKVSRGGSSREYTMEQIFHRFHNTWDKKIPSKVRSLKGNKIGLNDMVDIWEAGVKTLFEVQAGKFTLKATKDHKIWTSKGWRPVSKLKVGDLVATDQTKKHQKVKQPKVKFKPRYNLLTVGPYYPHGHYTTIHGNRRKKAEKHRLIYEANLNGLTLKTFITSTYDRKNNLKTVDPLKFHIHHIDHNPKNNSLSNLEKLTKEEHLKRHGNSSYFQHGNIYWEKVSKITKLGKEMTYDIECRNPFPSFVANGVVVHNSGKTMTAINILRHWMGREQRYLSTLILCPPVIVDQWEQEFLKHSRLKFKIVKLQGSGVKRKRALREALDSGEPKIFITNYETVLMKDVYRLLWEAGIQVLICDESHKLKNGQAKRTQAVMNLADRARYRLLLTGSPLLNTPMDLWSQYRIMDRGERFGQNFYSFRAKFFYDKNAGMPKHKYFPHWVPRPKTRDQFAHIIDTTAMRVKKSECLDLPPLVKEELNVNLSPEQSKAYNELKQDLVTYLDSGAATAPIALTKCLRLQQITTGFVSLEDGGTHEFKAVPRLDALRDILEQVTPDNKVIVWSAFKHNYKKIREICNELGVKSVEIHGGQSEKQKRDAIESFRSADDVKVCIANPKAGGVGLNLVEASYSVYFSRGFSLEDDMQSEARNYRGGSEIHEKVTRIDLVCGGTIDNVIATALKRKQDLAENILDIREHL